MEHPWQKSKEVQLREPLFSDVMESDPKREDLKPFILNQAPKLPVPMSFTGMAI